MRSLGHDVVVFTPEDGELSKRLKEKDSEVDIVNFQWSKNAYWNPFLLWSLKKLFRQKNIDVMIYNALIDVRVAAYVAKQAGVGSNIYRVGMPVAPKLDWSYRRAFQKGLDLIVSNSHESLKIIKRDAKNIIGTEVSCHVITNGVNLETFKPRPQDLREGEPLTFGNCSRLSHQKGLDLFLQVCHKLKVEHKCHYLAILGGGGEEESNLTQLKAELELDEQVEMIGFVAQAEKFYSNLDFLLFTSRFEGASNTIIESFACGVPVIAFDTSSMSEMIEHGKNGFLVPAFDIDQMSHYARELLMDRNKCRQMGEFARETALKYYDQNKIQKQWEELILSTK